MRLTAARKRMVVKKPVAADKPGQSAVFILGGGSPRISFCKLEPQIQDGAGASTNAGYDFFLQVTDARPTTGGLSGATPGEAVRGVWLIPIDCPCSCL